MTVFGHEFVDMLHLIQFKVPGDIGGHMFDFLVGTLIEGTRLGMLWGRSVTVGILVMMRSSHTRRAAMPHTTIAISRGRKSGKISPPNPSRR